MSDEAIQGLRDKFTEFIELRDEKAIATKKADKLKDDYKKLQEEIWEAMDNAGLSSLKLEIGNESINFVAKETLFGNIYDRDAAFAAFEKMGRSDELTKTAEQKARINELVRECLENGQELPDGVDYYGQKVISVSRKAL